MCYTATQPTLIKSENLNSDLLNLTRIFNRWLKMLTSYGKLDESSLQDDFTAIAKVLKSHGTTKDIKRAVQGCRNYALAARMQIEDLISSLSSALNLFCMALENKELRKVKKAYADQGMTERYRPLAKRLAKEKIRKIDREVIYTDRHTDDAETTSFNLYNKKYLEYDADLRAPGSHWKVQTHNSKGKKVLVAKFSYNTYEEAVEACTRYMMAHPEDPSPISPYKCDYCRKWHIGHTRFTQEFSDITTEKSQETDEKISA